MLTPLDDTLLHQAPLTFENAAVSDHRFFDRFIVSATAPDGGVGFYAGMGLYKNMNVLDGFASVRRDGRQHNLRMSRALRPDFDLQLGDFRVEVIEGLKRIRYVLEPGDHPAAFDLTFAGLLEAHEEDPHFMRLDGRVNTDYLRFNQLGHVSGVISIDGEEHRADRWLSWRDRSWGVRPNVGGFEPGPKRGGGFPSAIRSGGKGMVLIYIGLASDNVAGGVQIIEDGQGARLYTTGHFGRLDGQQSPVVEATAKIQVYPGTRMFKHVEVQARTADGETYDISIDPIGRAWVNKGMGYEAGFNDGLGHGAWRGADLLIETDAYDVSDVEKVGMPDGSVLTPAHREQSVNVTVNGEAGHGFFPYMIVGDVQQLKEG